MFLDISKLEIGTLSIERHYNAGEIPFDYREYKLGDNWIFAAEITKNSKQELDVKGRIKGVVHVFCDRCLAPFDYEVDRKFDVYMIPARRLHGEFKRELEQEQMDENYYSDPLISLVDVISEQVILALPYKFLCSPDCNGLCPICGCNLNVEKCSCNLKKADSRWLLLREMKKKIDNKIN